MAKLYFGEIAAGMVVFTTVMVFDIFTFGVKWHDLANEIVRSNQIDEDKRKHYEIFGRKGQGVLILIGLLLCIGWVLAAGQT